MCGRGGRGHGSTSPGFQSSLSLLLCDRRMGLSPHVPAVRASWLPAQDSRAAAAHQPRSPLPIPPCGVGPSPGTGPPARGDRCEFSLVPGRVPQEGAWLAELPGGVGMRPHSPRGGLAGFLARDSAAYAHVSGVSVWDTHLLHHTQKETLQRRAGRGLRGPGDGPEGTGCVVCPTKGSAGRAALLVWPRLPRVRSSDFLPVLSDTA